MYLPENFFAYTLGSRVNSEVSLSSLFKPKRIFNCLACPSKGSPAEKAGIISGDILIAFNDHTIETADHLFKQLTEDKIGQFQHLVILRHFAKTELRITST